MKEIPKEWYWGDTLGDVVLRLIEEKKKDSEEFKFLERFYGIEKLREVYRRAREEKKARAEKQSLLHGQVPDSKL